MRLIALSAEAGKGKSVMVDDEHFDYLNQWKWNLGGSGYAMRNKTYSEKESRIVTIQQDIMEHFHGHKVNNKQIISLKDRNPLNAQSSNIEIVSYSINAAGQRVQRRQKHSKYKGVSKYPENEQRGWKCWYAYIKKKGQSRLMSPLFKTEEEAAAWYDEKAQELFGSAATLNLS